MQNFWDGFEKRAAAFTHGGYAMNLAKASAKPVKNFVQGVTSVGRKAAQAATKSYAPETVRALADTTLGKMKRNIMSI